MATIYEKEMLTLEEAAQLLGVSKITLRRWTSDGKLTHIRVGERRDRRFRRTDLEDYLARRIRQGSDVPQAFPTDSFNPSAQV